MKFLKLLTKEMVTVMDAMDILKKIGLTHEALVTYDWGSTEEDMNDPPEIDPPEKPEVPNTPTEKEASQTTI